MHVLQRHQRSLRVQVPKNHILTQNLYYYNYYPKPKYLIIGYMDPLGIGSPKPAILRQDFEGRHLRRPLGRFELLTVNIT